MRISLALRATNCYKISTPVYRTIFFNASVIMKQGLSPTSYMKFGVCVSLFALAPFALPPSLMSYNEYKNKRVREWQDSVFSWWQKAGLCGHCCCCCCMCVCVCVCVCVSRQKRQWESTYGSSVSSVLQKIIIETILIIQNCSTNQYTEQNYFPPVQVISKYCVFLSTTFIW